MSKYVADFETTTNSDFTRVWAYAICEIGNPDNVIMGTSLDEFMSWCRKQKDNPVIFFHNLKFDAQAIMYWLFKNGFDHAAKPAEKATNTFSTSITDKNLYYQIEVFFYLKGKKVKKVTFQDSLKLIPLSVDGIAKAFKLPIQKGTIDYHSHNDLPDNTPLTDEEKEYIRNDVQIVAHAVDFFHKQGLNKMTIGSCALEEYKKTISKRAFTRYYPVPNPQYHWDVKQSYKGGFTYLVPEFAGKTLGKGIVLDVNSLYPSVMYQNYLPFGTPLFFTGEYEPDPIYPIYIQTIRCHFDLKPGKLPTIQIKDDERFKANEWLTSSNDEEVVLCLNSVDLKLFLEHYDTENLVYINGWKYKATKGLFTDYIEKWSQAKIKAKEEKNHGMYLIAKLFLNSLYGKFGTDIRKKSKIPWFDKDQDIVKFEDSDPELKDGVYVAMASFITSLARLKTITAFQTVLDNFNTGKSKAMPVYADTDSLHILLNGEDEKEFLANSGLEIHETDLGAWDHEGSFNKAKFLRQKCYIENHIIEDYEDDKGNLITAESQYEKGLKGETKFLYSKDKQGYYKLKITVSGMPSECYDQVTFKNFKIGAEYKGRKQPKVIPGGCVLQSVDFTIKR